MEKLQFGVMITSLNSWLDYNFNAVALAYLGILYLYYFAIIFCFFYIF